MSHAFAESDPPVLPLAALRRFVGRAKEPKRTEQCELCSKPLAPEHQHLIEPHQRRLACVCDPCAVLFDQPGARRYRRVPRRIRRLADFQLPDADWDRLLIPINMAFFFHDTAASRVVAIYPSPAGATESLPDAEAWDELVQNNSVLTTIEPDVEALLVNRLGGRQGFAENEYFLVPIDQCYKLVGLLRTHWRGFSGGAEVWQHVGRFFAELNERSTVAPGAAPTGQQQVAP